MYFVLSIFLKPQEGVRFYVFSQTLTSLKEDKGVRARMVYYPGDFYLHYLTVFVLVYRVF